MQAGNTTKYSYTGPFGNIYCIFEGQSLVEVSIMKKGPGDRDFTGLKEGPGRPLFLNELKAYFKGELKSFMQKIKFTKGTPFEQRVWLALKEIPYGETRTYKWIAEKAGSPGAVRAAGQALKKNPLPIILPCHRVIASDGSIGGFACGVEIKRWLLRHEKAKDLLLSA